MIISTSNAIANNTPSLVAGTVTSGTALINVLNPDFSNLVSSASSTFTFTVGASVGCDYIGLHGCRLPVGTVVTVSAAGFTDSFTVTDKENPNIVFYTNNTSMDNIQVSLVGAGTKTISYVQAGTATVVPWGTNAGQSLYYLGYNSKNRTSVGSLGSPVLRTQNKVAPKLRLTIKNVLKAWARDDLKQIFNHYQTYGVLSILDYENDDKPDESVAGFNLDGVDVKTHSQTLELVDVSMTLQVSV